TPLDAESAAIIRAVGPFHNKLADHLANFEKMRLPNIASVTAEWQRQTWDELRRAVADPALAEPLKENFTPLRFNRFLWVPLSRTLAERGIVVRIAEWPAST